MRRLILAAALLARVWGARLTATAASAEETCTGYNCRLLPRLGGGGRDCESKKEQTVS